jgi:hypothetical protein
MPEVLSLVIEFQIVKAIIFSIPDLTPHSTGLLPSYSDFCDDGLWQ